MRTIHLAIALNEETNDAAIDKAIEIFNKLFYTKEIEGYRIWLSTKEEIDTYRTKILEFLGKNFKDYRDI
jgi:hypothetical protein